MSRSFVLATLAAFSFGCSAGTEALGPGQIDSGIVADAGIPASKPDAQTALDAGFADSGQADAGHPPGRLAIFNENIPEPGIALAGQQELVVNRYRFHAYGEPIEVNAFAVINDLSGDFDTPARGHSVLQVRVSLGYPAPGGNGGGVRTLSPVRMMEHRAFFDSQSFNVPADGDVMVEIAVDIWSKVDFGEKISGTQHRLGISEVTVRGVDSGSLNIPVEWHVDETLQPWVVRVSKPELSAEPGLPVTIFNGFNQLIGIVASGNPGPVSFGRLTFKVTVLGFAHPGANIRDFRLIRDGWEVPMGDVNIVAVWSPATGTTVIDLQRDPNGLKAMSGGVPSGTHIIVVSFNEEEVVGPGVGHNYHIQAEVVGTIVSSVLTTALADEDRTIQVAGITSAATCTPFEDQPCSTGNGNTARIFDTGFGESLLSSTEQFVFVDGTPPSGRRTIWSDLSADNHTYPVVVGGQVVGASGSYDWTNGYRLAPVPPHTLTY